jgi:outer membrane protein insertion porin family
VHRGMVNYQGRAPAQPPGPETRWPRLGRPLLVVICLVLLLAPQKGAGAAEAPPAAEPQGRVLHSLKIIGANIVPKKKLLAEMTMPRSPLIRFPWKKPPAFKEEELEGDLLRLKAYYQGQGFYHTEIVPKIESKDHQVTVTLHITEGPYVQVVAEEVQVAPAAPPVDLSSLKKKWPLNPGDRFSGDGYEALKRLYLDYLLDHGYPHTAVEGKVLLDPEKNTARIEVTVNAGTLGYFGDIRITGNGETPDYLILRQLTFKPGDVFSFQKIYESQRKLYGLDLFQTVSINPETGKEKERRIPMEVIVKEKKRHSFKAGLGYGDEDQFRAKLGLRFRNLDGGGRTLDLEGKYSSIEDRVVTTFTNPQLWASRCDLVLQGGYVLRYLPGYNDRSFFTQERLERDLPWNLRAYVGHSLEFARPFDIPDETLAILTNTSTEKLYRSSMLLLGLRRETLDNPVDPHRGGLLAWAGEFAPNFLGSNLEFIRNVVESRRYYAPWDGTDFILAGRLRFGFIQPIQSTEQIPIFYRFFAGGYDSVRGYRLDYLGPRNATGQPLGGEALMEGSLEARIPIYKEIRGVAFMDFGNVFFNIPDFNLGQLKYAAGVGLRYMTPVGPVGIDIGFPLNPISEHKDNYHINFSIGQTF